MFNFLNSTKCVITGLVLATSCSISYAKCRQEIKDLPVVPNGLMATAEQFVESKNAILQYSQSAMDYSLCAHKENDKRSHKRGERALWKTNKLAKQYNQAYDLFVNNQSIATNTHEQLLASTNL